MSIRSSRRSRSLRSLETRRVQHFLTAGKRFVVDLFSEKHDAVWNRLGEQFCFAAIFGAVLLLVGNFIRWALMR